ncbi:MAG: hypothetical protein ACXWW7_09540 [Nocardioides sp.]
MRTTTRYAALAATLTALAACGADDTATTKSSGPEDTSAAPTTSTAAGLPSEIPTPDLDPADFVVGIDNPYLPFTPGTRWIYESKSTEGDERIVVTVTDRSKVVDGVQATVVHDRVTTPDGELIEDTFDWYAQDVDGNVWYLGEDTTAYEDGKTSKEGSWEAGVDGALAGVVMPAAPQVGDAYAQEYLDGEAEDEGEVLALDEEATVPFGSYTGLVMTADTTPLEPDMVEHKYYARGVGLVYEEMVTPGDDRVRLVEMTTP